MFNSIYLVLSILFFETTIGYLWGLIGLELVADSIIDSFLHTLTF